MSLMEKISENVEFIKKRIIQNDKNKDGSVYIIDEQKDKELNNLVITNMLENIMYELENIKKEISTIKKTSRTTRKKSTTKKRTSCK